MRPLIGDPFFLLITSFFGINWRYSSRRPQFLRALSINATTQPRPRFYLFWQNESIRKNGISRNDVCPVECCPATPLKVGFNRGEAHRGQVEVVLPDGTRCDCLTETHAIEFDFGRGWGEAIGQKFG
jgi:hypothetical protein